MADEQAKQKGISKVWALPVAALAAIALALKTALKPADKRAAVVAAAVRELGKGDQTPYVTDALGYPTTAIYSWCGMFALWALHQAGLAKAWHWELGTGFLYRLPRVPPNTLPQPGDIAYFHEPFRHHAIVESVDPIAMTVTIINGNGTDGKVTRSTVPVSQPTAFYSIDPLVQRKAA